MTYQYDKNQVRYSLEKDTPGELNWLFFPGGPGADSSYLKDLINLLNLPGKIWRIDLPGNGDNPPINLTDFKNWPDFFISTIQSFSNPVLIGHSFSATFPLLFPELENCLKGYIAINATSSFWLDAAREYREKQSIKIPSEPLLEFVEKPSKETFYIALESLVPSYFAKDHRQIGWDMLKNLPFNYNAPAWWQNYAKEIDFSNIWVPKNVPSVIINSTEDGIIPHSLIQNDIRFDRPNIEKENIYKAGHYPWVEKPQEIKEIINRFAKKYNVRI